MEHNIGNRTYIVAAVEPLDVDGVRTIEVGTIAWLIAFVALLPFYGRLEDAGRTWWRWTCPSAVGLGLLGLENCRRRSNARAERAVVRDLPLAPRRADEPGRRPLGTSGRGGERRLSKRRDRGTRSRQCVETI